MLRKTSVPGFSKNLKSNVLINSNVNPELIKAGRQKAREFRALIAKVDDNRRKIDELFLLVKRLEEKISV